MYPLSQAVSVLFISNEISAIAENIYMLDFMYIKKATTHITYIL